MASIRRRGTDAVDHGVDLLAAEPEGDTVLIRSDGAAAPAVSTPVRDLPEDLLNAPVGMEDDLAHALARRPNRSTLPGATAVLGAAVLVAGGFLGGVLTQKHEGGRSGTAGAGFAAARSRTGGTTATGTGTGSGTAARGAGTGAPAAGGTTGAAGGATFGTVKLVDPTTNTLYVTETDGSILVVKTSKTTTVKVTKNGTPEDLAPGSTVVVQGSTAADGSITATSVTEGGAGGLGAAGGFGRGGFAGRTGTGGAGGAGTGAGNGSTSGGSGNGSGGGQ